MTAFVDRFDRNIDRNMTVISENRNIDLIGIQMVNHILIYKSHLITFNSSFKFSISRFQCEFQSQ